jgi:hypothetical protein
MYGFPIHLASALSQESPSGGSGRWLGVPGLLGLPGLLPPAPASGSCPWLLIPGLLPPAGPPGSCIDNQLSSNRPIK